MASTRIVDFTRKPTDKEREQLQRRLARLQVPGLPEHLERIEAKLLAHERSAGKLRTEGLRLRQPFSYLEEPIDGDFSDRKAPPRPLRPPATRISNSLGSALRLELTTLALLQLRRKPGVRARLSDLEIPIAGDSQHAGWADLVAALPTDSNVGGHFYNSRDKRARTVRSALKRLEKDGLVDASAGPGAKNRFENFVPLHEAGADARGEREEYTIPELGSSFVFAVPPGFILNGWLHVLEDSEIAVLLMAACGAGGWWDRDGQVFSGEVRLLHYGIHRAPFAAARKTLEWFGLLDVEEIDRHVDGRAEFNLHRVHRITLRGAGFEVQALPAIQDAIERQLKR
ncbi:hypothetical protein SAMN05428985_11513 [Nocardioides sp. YR527]|uniref:hypothetical protein n=1 Tax=Nocardioides sp. YR527 TaxID=1881028 RepID=UPI00088450D2|nr:hypothetical protein [Nocardioides sp. YR527]SDL33755.1 hypothetical protein SAMN05428985_11513 [Nocardioides sp. YR527]